MIDVLGAVFAKALFAFALKISKTVSRELNYSTELTRYLRDNDTINNQIQRITTSIALEYPNDTNSSLEYFKEFLCSAEITAIINQLLAASLLKEHNFETIEHELELILALRYHDSLVDTKMVARDLIKLFLEGCRITLTKAVSRDSLTAHDNLESLRFSILRDELRTGINNILLLESFSRTSITDIERFVELIRIQMHNRHQYITPPNLEREGRKNINDLYVQPHISLDPYNTIEESDHFIGDVLSKNLRVVVLGDPGGGKTTLCDKLCYDLTDPSAPLLINGQVLVPFHVILRDYAIDKKQHKWSLIDYIYNYTKSTFSIEPPINCLQYLFLNGRALILLDGLDELLDPAFRCEIRDEIESLATLMPTLSMVITSRFVGYDQAPLDKSRFLATRVAPFSQGQVEQYTRKWFDLQEDYTSNEKKLRADGFLRESAFSPDIRSNALMLALMLIMYIGEGFIPKHRTVLYEKCAELLFDRWDKHRHIRENYPYEFDIKPVIAYIAYWIYSNSEQQNGVSERSLINKATEYLFERRYEKVNEAQQAATDFVRFCTGRAWVFTDTGFNDFGERLYQFTHRSFLEYFSAVYLVRRFISADELINEILPHIKIMQMDLVCQLAFQLLSKTVEDADDDLVLNVLNAQENFSDEEWLNVLSFISRAIVFLNPRPTVVRQAIDRIIDGLRNYSLTITPKHSDSGEPLSGWNDLDRKGLFACLGASQRVGENVYQAIHAKLASYIESNDAHNIKVALWLSSTLHIFNSWHTENTTNQELYDKYSTELLHDVFDTALHSYLKLIIEDEFILCTAVKHNLLDINIVNDQCGITALFRDYSCKMWLNTFWSSYAGSLIWLFIFMQSSKYHSLSVLLSQIACIGEIVMHSKLPCIDQTSSEHFFTSLRHDERVMRLKDTTRMDEQPTGSVLFGAFVIAAILIEGAEDHMRMSEVKTFIQIAKGNLGPLLESALTVRYYNANSDELNNVIIIYKLSDDEREFIVSWAKKIIRITNKSIITGRA